MKSNSQKASDHYVCALCLNVASLLAQDWLENGGEMHSSSASVYALQTANWLQVLGTAELAQIHQRIRHQLHAVVSLLDVFKTQQQPLELIFPGKGPFDPHPQRMDRCVEEAFASTLGHLAVARILLDVGDHAGIENALPIARGIKAAIEVEVGPSQVQPDLLGHLLQGLQALGKEHHIRFIDGSHGDGS